METGEQNTHTQNSAPVPGGAPQGDNTLLMGVLSYLGILVVIPYLMAKQNPKVAFHIRQGLVLAVIEIGVWVLASTLWILAPVLMLINLGALILSIVGIVNVIQDKEVELPLVGKFSHYFNNI